MTCDSGTPELHLGDVVAIADGSAWQGERGRVVAINGASVTVEVMADMIANRRVVGRVPTLVRVAWWKDVQAAER